MHLKQKGNHTGRTKLHHFDLSDGVGIKGPTRLCSRLMKDMDVDISVHRDMLTHSPCCVGCFWLLQPMYHECFSFFLDYKLCELQGNGNNKYIRVLSCPPASTPVHAIEARNINL